MADYTISTSQVSTPSLSIAAGAQDRITFTGRYAGKVRVVIHSGSSPLWVTADGRDPNPALGFAYPALPGVSEIGSRGVPSVVRVHATGPTTYSVEK